MLLIRKETQTSQVARILEKKIISGEIAPETKLSSTRDLANQFSVSQQVIKSAMTDLEKKGLIDRKPRKGIYVSQNVYCPKKKEVVSLRIGYSELFRDYTDKFLGLDASHSCKNFDFTIKNISKDNYSSKIFDYELMKLEEQKPDCLLISFPSISREQVERCLALSFPVIFIGDFARVEFPDLKYNQMVEDTAERAKAIVSKAIELGCKNIACMGSLLSFSFGQVYKQAAVEVAEASNVNLVYIEHSDGGPDIKIVIDNRRHTVGTYRDILEQSDAIILDGCQKIESFTDVFREFELEFPGKRTIIADGDMYQGCMHVVCDYTDLAKVAMSHINDIIENPDKIKKLKLGGLIKRNFYTIS